MRLSLATLNYMTANLQIVHRGCYAAARIDVENARDTPGPHLREQYELRAIEWQEDGARLSARQRARYLEDQSLDLAMGRA